MYQPDERERVLATMEESFEAYLQGLRRSGKPPGTIHAYGWALKDLAQFLAERRIRTTNKLSKESLEDWQDSQIGRWRPKTRQLASTVVRGWLEWAEDREQVPPRLARVIATVKAPPRLPRPIAREHLDQILAYLAPRRPGAGFLYLRDRALFHYLLATGARIAEALQVEREGWNSYTVRQKGGREKVLELGDQAREIISHYLEARTDQLPWLWVTQSPTHPITRLSAESANDAWRRLAKTVGVPPFTSHRVRHSCGTLLYDKTRDIFAVAEHLGHANLSSVQGYVRVSAEQRKQNLTLIEGAFAVSENQGPAEVKGRPDKRTNRNGGKRQRKKRYNA